MSLFKQYLLRTYDYLYLHLPQKIINWKEWQRSEIFASETGLKVFIPTIFPIRLSGLFILVCIWVALPKTSQTMCTPELTFRFIIWVCFDVGFFSLIKYTWKTTIYIKKKHNNNNYNSNNSHNENDNNKDKLLREVGDFVFYFKNVGADHTEIPFPNIS